MSERKNLGGTDWLAVSAFLVGTLVLVLMSIALWRGTEGAEGSAAIARGIAAAIGVVPGLLAGAGLAFLGGRAFLRGERGAFGRDVAGVLGVAASLAILLGALAPDAGGALGAATGGLAAERTHPSLGALLGVLALFAVVRFAWLRPGLARPSAAGDARRPTSAPPRAEAEGVTAAESAMLFPVRGAAARVELLPLEPAEAKDAPPARAASAPPSPYPENVRAQGKIPPGAKPLGVEPDPAVYRWTAPAARAEVAPTAPASAPATAAGPTGSASGPQAGQQSGAGVDLRRDLAQARAELAAAASGATAEELAAEPATEAGERPMPPRPSWETTGLAEDEEPVDAYGTPLSLVERVRHERDGDEPIAIPRELDALAEDESQDETEDDAEDGDAVRVELAGAVEEEAEVELEDELEDELEAEVELDDEAELDEDELPAGALVAEEDLEELEVIAELEEETEIVVELQGVQRNGVEASEPAEADEDPFEARAALPELADELVGEEAPSAGNRSARARGPAARATDPEPLAGPGLFDELEPAPQAGRERQVELQPVAPEPPERAHKRIPADLDPRNKLLAEVGCMFVERGRVAVSMLQRQYDMDFDEACRVLDDLQELGLIGPYLGGQSRDILLTREQWLEKVGAA